MCNDDYDDVCKDCRDKEAEEGVDEEGWPEDFIMSPIKDDQEFPMVLAMTSNKCFIGSFIPTEEEDARGVLLSTPLLMAEMLDEKKQLTVMMSKMLHSLGIQDAIRVRYDTFMFLKSKSSADKRLVLAYEKEVERHAIRDAGFVSATMQDIANIGKA